MLTLRMNSQSWPSRPAVLVKRKRLCMVACNARTEQLNSLGSIG